MAFHRRCFGTSNVKNSKPEVDQQGNHTSKHKVHLTTAMFSEEDFARGVAISVENLNSVHGVVEERVGGTFYSWKKRNIRLEDGYLLCYKTDISGKCRMLPLHLCMVRPSRKTTFKVVCATQFNLKFRASSNAAMREWVAAIQNGIAKALSCCNEPKSDRYTGKDMLAMLYRINPINRICADCSAQDPTWISTTFGCLLCIECSGVHRSLGTHISKIRSFELDKWSDKIDMVEKLDNADVNSVFEYHIPMTSQKPNILSDRESREKYIYDKYVRKAFMKKQFRKSGREVSAEIITEIYKQLKPTSHIGSNVFAKKVPYGPDSPQSRKMSLGNTVLDMMASNPILNRRGSLTPSPLSSSFRRSSVAPSSPFRRSSIAPSSPLGKSPLSPTPVKREGSLVGLRRSSMMPAIGGGSTKLYSLSGSGGIPRHVALYPAPMACA